MLYRGVARSDVLEKTGFSWASLEIPGVRKTRVRGLQLEIFLNKQEARLYDELKAVMRGGSLGGILLRYGLYHADEAFKECASGPLDRFRSSSRRRSR